MAHSVRLWVQILAGSNIWHGGCAYSATNCSMAETVADPA